jgi:subfamily B ATP-binding cassette protein HlyB/CyaB
VEQASNTAGVDPGLVSLALLARFHGKAAEPAQMAHDLGLTARAGAQDLMLAARRLELKARLAPLDFRRAAAGSLPLPCIVELTGTDGDCGE